MKRIHLIAGSLLVVLSACGNQTSVQEDLLGADDSRDSETSAFQTNAFRTEEPAASDIQQARLNWLRASTPASPAAGSAQGEGGNSSGTK